MSATSTALPRGLRWLDNGQAVLSGELLVLADRLDHAFARVAAQCGAQDHRFGAFVSAADLQRVDYFGSFPHLATFAASLDPDEANLAAFAAGDPVAADGAVRLTKLEPVRDVLTPAACYHVYPYLAGAEMDEPHYVTTRNTCYRRESHYQPLRRQWAFTMREVVCLGTAAEVGALLERTRALVDALAAALALPVAWETATDPFFQPSRNPAYLAQRVNPTKHELVVGGLAIASANLHQDHFGAAFGIMRDGTPAFSGCVAFGIERWLHAVITVHGDDPAGWPPIAAGR